MRSEETKRYKSAISGVLIVDKPIGKTSHDIVQIIRKGTGIRRIGHTGTLDPRASGVLVILIGPAVRLSEYLQSDIKRYEATIRLGSVSDTYDGDGLIETTGADMNISEDQISEAMKKFVGEIEQTPPVYSALKIKGRKAYEMAREGIDFEIPSRKVTVYSMDLIEYNPPELSVDILCSSGNIQVVLCLHRCLIQQISSPVDTGIHNGIIIQSESFNCIIIKYQIILGSIWLVICYNLISQSCIRITVCHFEHTSRHLNTNRRIHRDFRFALLTTACSYQNYAICTTHTEHGSSRSIFQNRHALYFIRVHLIKRTFYTIHQNQRRGSTFC